MLDLNSLRSALDGVLSRDHGRLLARWRRLSGARPAPADKDVAALRAAIDASTARRALRASRVPEVRLDESLPITARADEIVELIRKH
jgi:ATP-dependent helicase HrpA